MDEHFKSVSEYKRGLKWFKQVLVEKMEQEEKRGIEDAEEEEEV